MSDPDSILLYSPREYPYAESPMLRFSEFHSRLITCLRDKVRSGELTERGLARATGISQPHIHNVLKGKKLFSLELSDTILRELDLDLLDLLDPADLRRYHARPVRPLPGCLAT